MATTTNYGWDTPDDTDLVKDGALAIRDLGQDVDTSLFSITTGKNVGMVHINTTTFSSVANVQINNVFSSDYDNYKIVFSNLTSSAGQTLSFQMSNGGTPVTTSTYGSQRLAVQSNAVAGVLTSSATSGALSVIGTNGLNYVSAEIMHPFLATITKTISTGNYSDVTDPFYIEMQNSRQSGATSFDGIRFLVAGTMSGTVRIYGYRNS
jgi:hypothetical protein